MKRLPTLLMLLLLGASATLAQDTFSIVAVDTVTRQVGSAGGSCLNDDQISGGVSIIGDVLPGRGAINTQSYWDYTNQQNARARLLAGDTPNQVLAWLQANDAGSDASIRQYGIVAFDQTGKPQSAAFTGTGCFDYKGHITGRNYSIQGNILLGRGILDSMEARFLRTPGTLSDKLMAALQGAKVRGADTRCYDEGISCQSAFIFVAKPGDTPTSPWLKLIVSKTPYGHEPIDSLQKIYDAWIAGHSAVPSGAALASEQVSITTDPATHTLRLQLNPVFLLHAGTTIALYNTLGRLVLQQPLTTFTVTLNTDTLGAGPVVLVLRDTDGKTFYSTTVLAP